MDRQPLSPEGSQTMSGFKFYIAEVFEAAVNLACVLTWHFGGCRVSYWWLNSWLGRWADDVITEYRQYGDPRGACDRCPRCDTKYRQSIPNPYFASERELAEWARWFGSDVSPADYAEWQRANPPAVRITGGSGLGTKTYAWMFCPNCKTGSMQTFDGRTA
jgi:hypothetical protein